MKKKYWQRFNFIEKGLVVFFGIGLIINIFDELIIGLNIPKEIINYLFWLALGLYLGFRLCRYEYTRIWRLIKKDEEKN